MTNATQHPTDEERASFSISAYRGIEVGLGKADPMAEIARKLEEQYPGHLILVQVGKFLHAYDKSAHTLNVLKKYQIKLVGTAEDPHLRVGFPAGNFKRRLWSMVDEFSIPYAVALGSREVGHTVYVSEHANGTASRSKTLPARRFIAFRVRPMRARDRGDNMLTNHISAGHYVRGRYLRALRQHENSGIDRTEAIAAYQAAFRHTGSTIYRENI